MKKYVSKDGDHIIIVPDSNQRLGSVEVNLDADVAVSDMSDKSVEIATKDLREANFVIRDVHRGRPRKKDVKIVTKYLAGIPVREPLDAICLACFDPGFLDSHGLTAIHYTIDDQDIHGSFQGYLLQREDGSVGVVSGKQLIEYLGQSHWKVLPSARQKAVADDVSETKASKDKQKADDN